MSLLFGDEEDLVPLLAEPGSGVGSGQGVSHVGGDIGFLQEGSQLHELTVREQSSEQNKVLNKRTMF